MNYPAYPQYQQYFNPNQYQYQPNMMPPVQQPQMAQVQQPMQQQYGAQQGLNGKYVDSIESVKATDVMMDGSIMFFPATDGKTIYTKQLQSDGTSRITTYTAETPQAEESKPSVTDILDGRLKAFREDILGGFDEINERFDKIERQLKPKTTRGKDE